MDQNFKKCSENSGAVAKYAVESNGGAADGARGAVQERDADADGAADPRNNLEAAAVRENRGKECLLLVSEPQSQGQEEAAPQDGSCRSLQPPCCS